MKDTTTTIHEAWCVTDDHANYIDGDCGCRCHGQVDGQESLIPLPTHDDGGCFLMSESRWFRFGEWMAVTPLRRWVLRYDGVAPRGLRFINRINGHVVMLAGGDQ